jgi:hypothetical protein
MLGSLARGSDPALNFRQSGPLDVQTLAGFALVVALTLP